MYRISSLSSKFSTLVFPSDNAASSRQRLESDLEPGSVTVPSREVMGDTVNVLVSSLIAIEDIWSVVGVAAEEIIFDAPVVDDGVVVIDDGDVMENALLDCGGAMIKARNAARADDVGLMVQVHNLVVNRANNSKS